MAGPTGTAVGAVGIGVAAEVDDIVCGVADGDSSGNRSECYEGEGGEGRVMHREVGRRLVETGVWPRIQMLALESGREEGSLS